MRPNGAGQHVLVIGSGARVAPSFYQIINRALEARSARQERVREENDPLLQQPHPVLCYLEYRYWWTVMAAIRLSSGGGMRRPVVCIGSSPLWCVVFSLLFVRSGKPSGFRFALAWGFRQEMRARIIADSLLRGSSNGRAP